MAGLDPVIHASAHSAIQLVSARGKMALERCKECGKELSTSAATCPHCGAPGPAAVPIKPKNIGCGTYILFGIAGLILLGFIGSLFPKSEQDQARDDGIMACIKAQHAVEDRLKAPATAEFSSCAFNPGIQTESDKQLYVVRGHVDSQNSFGAKIRSTFVVTMRKITDDDWSSESVLIN